MSNNPFLVAYNTNNVSQTGGFNLNNGLSGNGHGINTNNSTQQRFGTFPSGNHSTQTTMDSYVNRGGNGGGNFLQQNNQNNQLNSNPFYKPSTGQNNMVTNNPSTSNSSYTNNFPRSTLGYGGSSIYTGGTFIPTKDDSSNNYGMDFPKFPTVHNNYDLSSNRNKICSYNKDDIGNANFYRIPKIKDEDSKKVLYSHSISALPEYFAFSHEELRYLHVLKKNNADFNQNSSYANVTRSVKANLISNSNNEYIGSMLEISEKSKLNEWLSKVLNNSAVDDTFKAMKDSNLTTPNRLGTNNLTGSNNFYKNNYSLGNSNSGTSNFLNNNNNNNNNINSNPFLNSGGNRTLGTNNTANVTTFNSNTNQLNNNSSNSNLMSFNNNFNNSNNNSTSGGNPFLKNTGSVSNGSSTGGNFTSGNTGNSNVTFGSNSLSNANNNFYNSNNTNGNMNPFGNNNSTNPFSNNNQSGNNNFFQNNQTTNQNPFLQNTNNKNNLGTTGFNMNTSNNLNNNPFNTPSFGVGNSNNNFNFNTNNNSNGFNIGFNTNNNMGFSNSNGMNNPNYNFSTNTNGFVNNNQMYNSSNMGFQNQVGYNQIHQNNLYNYSSQHQSSDYVLSKTLQEFGQELEQPNLIEKLRKNNQEFQKRAYEELDNYWKDNQFKKQTNRYGHLDPNQYRRKDSFIPSDIIDPEVRKKLKKSLNGEKVYPTSARSFNFYSSQHSKNSEQQEKKINNFEVIQSIPENNRFNRNLKPFQQKNRNYDSTQNRKLNENSKEMMNQFLIPVKNQIRISENDFYRKEETPKSQSGCDVLINREENPEKFKRVNHPPLTHRLKIVFDEPKYFEYTVKTEKEVSYLNLKFKIIQHIQKFEEFSCFILKPEDIGFVIDGAPNNSNRGSFNLDLIESKNADNSPLTNTTETNSRMPLKEVSIKGGIANLDLLNKMRQVVKKNLNLNTQINGSKSQSVKNSQVESNQSIQSDLPSYIPKLTKNYTTIPSFEELKTMSQTELSNIKFLIVENEFAKVEYEFIDITHTNLDCLVLTKLDFRVEKTDEKSYNIFNDNFKSLVFKGIKNEKDLHSEEDERLFIEECKRFCRRFKSNFVYYKLENCTLVMEKPLRDLNFKNSYFP